jgi:hypothetical protein
MLKAAIIDYDRSGDSEGLCLKFLHTNDDLREVLKYRVIKANGALRTRLSSIGDRTGVLL